jgi:hypothetical protein
MPLMILLTVICSFIRVKSSRIALNRGPISLKSGRIRGSGSQQSSMSRPTRGERMEENEPGLTFFSVTKWTRREARSVCIARPALLLGRSNDSYGLLRVASSHKMTPNEYTSEGIPEDLPIMDSLAIYRSDPATSSWIHSSSS